MKTAICALFAESKQAWYAGIKPCACGGKAGEVRGYCKGVSLVRFECMNCGLGEPFRVMCANERSRWYLTNRSNRTLRRSALSRAEAYAIIVPRCKKIRASKRRQLHERRRALSWAWKNLPCYPMQRVTTSMCQVVGGSPWVAWFLPIVVCDGTTSRTIDVRCGTMARFSLRRNGSQQYGYTTCPALQPYGNDWIAAFRKLSATKRDECWATQPKHKRQVNRESARLVRQDDCHNFWAAFAMSGVR